MPLACRLTDLHLNPTDGCGCPGCTHCVVGPAITGSPNTFCNGLPTLRVTVDLGTHCCCCGPNIWGPLIGSPNIFVNGLAWSRVGDTNWCCGGSGRMITGSSNTILN